MKLALGFLLCLSLWGQSVTITSPSNGATIQAVNLTNGRELAITSTVTEPSPPAARTHHLCATQNGRPINPQNCSYAAPWTIKAYPGLWGDGAVDYVVTTYDYAGNVLATSATVTATTRIIGLANSVTAAPTSGIGNITFSKWNGINQGGACGIDMYIDGFKISTGSSPYSTGETCPGGQPQFNNVDSTKWKNGFHEIWGNMAGGGGIDPYLAADTFVAGNIASGTTVTLTAPQNHFLTTNRPVFFTTSGTLPTPLVAGAFWGPQTSATSPTNLALGAVCASGSCTVTLNAPPATANGAIVDVEGWTHDGAGNQPIYELVACEGRFVVTGSTGNTFTYTNAACPDNTAHNNPVVLSVVTTASHAIYVSATTVQFATAPNGSAISLGAGSTGTHTVTAQMVGYYNDPTVTTPNAYVFGNGSPIGFARKVVDFENGHTAMEYRPSHLEVNGIVGQNGDSLCGKVVYTDDLSPTTPDCSMVTYTVVPDGGFTGVLTVNATTGVPSFTGAGWAQISSTYSTFPAVTTYVHVQTGAVTNNSFRHNGAIGSYIAGQSFIPTSLWFADCQKASTYVSDISLRWTWLGKLMFESGYNTCFTAGLASSNVGNPLASSCPLSPLPTADTNIRTWADGFAATYGVPMSFETDISILGYPPQTGPSVLYQKLGYDRQACVTNYIANQKADGRYHFLFGVDEMNVYMFGNTPNYNNLIGGANFSNIAVSGGTGTFTGSINMGAAGVWNQANGTGAMVFFSGATTNTCLNGWRYPLTANGDNATFTTTFTFASPCGSVASALASDPGLKMDWIAGGGQTTFQSTVHPHACTMPKYLGGSFNAIYQGWSLVTDNNLNTQADTSLISIVSDGTTYTGHQTGHGFAEGHNVWISGATTTTALNGIYPIHVVDANTWTAPGTVGNVASSGTYNSGNNASAVIAYDCALPSNYMVWLRSLIHSGGDIAVNQPVIGTTYGNGPATAAWNDPAVEDAGNLYFAQAESPVLGERGMLGDAIKSIATSALTPRAYQGQTKKMLLGTHGIYGVKHHTGYLIDPAQDTPAILNWDASEYIAVMANSLAYGVTGSRLTWNQDSNGPQYLLLPGTVSWGNRLGVENTKPWAAIARGNQLSAHLNQYILQPHANSPYPGLMFNALQTTSIYGNMLMEPCNLDGTTETRTIDLTGIRLAGGSIYQAILGLYSLQFKPLAGNPSSDTHQMCGTGAGETVAYIAQPSGAVSDLTPTTFAAPIPIPYGYTQYAVRVGYYPRDMTSDPVTPCTSGCTINLHRLGGPVWYQNMYSLDSTWNPLTTTIGEPTLLAGQ
jgi:hypothetical protein